MFTLRRPSYFKLMSFLYAVPSIAYLLVFFYAPITIIIMYSFFRGGLSAGSSPSFTLDNYVRFLTDEIAVNVFLNTLFISAVIFLVVILVAYPIAYFLARIVPPHWSLRIILLIVIPLEMNYLIRAFAWRNVLGENGFINAVLISSGLVSQPVVFLFHNIYAVIIVVLHNSLPYAIIPIYIVLHNIPKNILNAAMDLGSNPISVFLRVTFPISLPGIAISFLFVFIPMMGEFAIPALVGGKTYLLGNLITRNFLVINDWAFASATTVILFVTTLSMILVLFKFLRVEMIYR